MSTQNKFSINRDCPNILYLMFVDDCIIFCRETKIAARNVKYILDHYCQGDKSTN